MKNRITTITCSLIISLGFFINPTHAQSLVEEIILKKLEIIVDGINNGDVESILGTVSPNALPTLKEEIKSELFGKQIAFRQNIQSSEVMSDTQLKINGVFSAEGSNWNMSGITNYYIFELLNDDIYLLDTNFHKQLNMEQALKDIFERAKPLLMIFGPLYLIGFIFWIWMLVDVCKRPIHNKGGYIVLVIFLNWLGALIYFFTARKKHKSTGGISYNEEPNTTPVAQAVNPSSITVPEPINKGLTPNVKKGLLWLTMPILSFILIAFLTLGLGLLTGDSSENTDLGRLKGVFSFILNLAGFISMIALFIGIPRGIYFLVKKEENSQNTPQ